MSDLRDRIAAAIASKEVVLDGWDYINNECAWLLADAVIAELGLHPVESLDRRFIRWVTAWRNNPEMGLADDE